MDGGFTLEDVRRLMKRDAEKLRRRAEEWRTHRSDVYGLSTGLDVLDALSGGLVPEEIITLAGGTGEGKSALAMQVVEWGAEVLFEQERTDYILVISAEMTRTSLYLRSACRRAGVDSTLLRRGLLTEWEMQRFHEELDYLTHLPLLIVDVNLASSEVLAFVRMLAEEGVTLAGVVVDYVQLLSDAGGGTQRVDTIMRTLARLKNETPASILLLSQYSRRKEWESHNQSGQAIDRPPKLSDLRDSGMVEQSSDQVWALHTQPNAAIYNWRGPRASERQLHVLKNRNGKRGVAPLWFIPTLTQFLAPRQMEQLALQAAQAELAVSQQQEDLYASGSRVGVVVDADDARDDDDGAGSNITAIER